jgi:8-oxo-dGTP pyrophosphatase MutT (NUDIX family)
MDRYRLVNRPGVTVVIVNNGKVLLLKRIRLPFIVNPGIWYFIGGARKARETALQNAYREIFEEIQVNRDDLKVLLSASVVIADKKRKERWRNKMFIMSSKNRGIRLNFEHTDYQWVSPGKLANYGDLAGAFEDSGEVFAMIRSALRKS